MQQTKRGHELSKLTEKHNLKGTLICVEGIDGSGKSTQLALLRDWLKSIGQDVIFTEWNSSELISQTTKLAKKKNMLSPRTFSLLHAVDFRKVYDFAIKPDLALYFDINPKLSMERICSNRAPKFYEAGMDLKLSNDPYESYMIFQGRVIKEYQKMVKEFGLVKIDATDSIHKKQVEIRAMLKKVLEEKGVII